MSKKSRKRKNKKNNNKPKVINNLTELYETKTHGASSLAGFNYQIVYSIYRTFELLKDDPSSSICLEGLEDLDIYNVNDSNISLNSNNKHIQIKRRQDQLEYYEFKKDILPNFLKIYKYDNNASFEIITNKKFANKINDLSKNGLGNISQKNTKGLSSEDKKELINICQENCSLLESTDDVSEFLSKLSFVIIEENNILQKTIENISNFYKENLNNPEILLPVIFTEFVNLAIKRRSFTQEDLNVLYITTQEAISTIDEFRAAGKGLINLLKWEKDSNIGDFYDAKGTRSGHIYEKVDIPRPIWQRKIQQAIEKTKACIILSSSGQGKSTLAYRFAFDNWEKNCIYKIDLLESLEQVQLVKKYLEIRNKYNLKTYILIDNANYKTKHWTEIVSDCSKYNMPILVTTRQEDWSRFVLGIQTNYEIIEPFLDENEAYLIFQNLKKLGKVHKEIKNSKQALEKIKEPYLLMEYIFYITKGTMLKDLLEEQIKYIERQEEPFKYKLLKKISLANCLGIPAPKDKLLKNLPDTLNENTIIDSVNNEYTKLEYNKYFTELHLIRSEHICEILHRNNYETQTALELIKDISLNDVYIFVSNFLARKNIEKDEFIEGLIDFSQDKDLSVILSILNGLFEAGERNLYTSNKHIFDQIYNIYGIDQLFNACAELAYIESLNPKVLDTIIKMNIPNNNAKNLKESVNKIRSVDRGLDYCKSFINNLNLKIYNDVNFIQIGKLTDWAFLCNSQINLDINMLTEKYNFEKQTLTDNSIFLQGLYRYDNSVYKKWYDNNIELLIPYLKLKLNCLDININNDSLSIQFIVDNDEVDINKQAVTRLKTLKCIFPFITSYQSKGIYNLPLELMPSYDGSLKNIPSKNLPYKSDVEKNIILNRIVIFNYIPHSHYEFQKKWNTHRNNIMFFLKDIDYLLNLKLTNTIYQTNQNDKRNKIYENLSSSLKYVPTISDDQNQCNNFVTATQRFLPEDLYCILANKQLIEFHNLFHIFYMSLNNKIDYKLVFYNLKKLILILPNFHKAFDEYFNNQLDYFEMNKIKEKESKLFNKLIKYFEIFKTNPQTFSFSKIDDYYHQFKEDQHTIKEKKLKTIGYYLINNKDNVINTFKSIKCISKYEEYLVIVFDVSSPLNFIYNPIGENFLDCITYFDEILEEFDYFLFVPCYNNSFFIKKGFKFYPHQISDFINIGFEDIKWEALVLIPLEEKIFDLLQYSLKKRPEIDLYIESASLSLIYNSLVSKYSSLTKYLNKNNHFENKLLENYFDNIKAEINNLKTIANKFEKACIAYVEGNEIEFDYINNPFSLFKNLSIDNIEDIENSIDFEEYRFNIYKLLSLNFPNQRI